MADLAQAQIQQHLQEVVYATPRPLDLEEERKVQDFCTQGCGCKLVKNGPCSSLFAAKHYTTMQANAAELSWAELNMVDMGQVRALTCLDNDILNSSKYRYPQKGRGKCTTRLSTTLSKWQIAYPAWCRVWKQFLPHVVVARPMTDLCWTCQQNSTAIICSANLSEEEKTEVSGLANNISAHVPFHNKYTVKQISPVDSWGSRSSPTACNMQAF